MPQFFDIDDRSVVELTNKLERMHRSALPVSIRQALNSAAFDARRESLKFFKKETEFDRTRKFFIKSHTIVNKSINTFKIEEMQPEMGVIKGKSHSGDNMELLERGGVIKDHMTPTRYVREGAVKSPVRRALYAKMYKNKPKGVIYKSGESKIIKTRDRILRVKRGGHWETLYILNRSFTLKKTPFIQHGGDKGAKKIGFYYEKQAKKRIAKLKGK